MEDIAVGLREKLSAGAQILSPGSDGYAQATERWSVLDAPSINIVVVPSTENDVAETVKHANSLNIPFSQDGKTAKIGGGTLSKTITHSLWAQEKQTGTLLGPGLSGGHGFLQGRHGLVSDQFVSMNIVLADGELRTIDKESDLWWAMQGAGHNFGIVTSVTSKIYDVEHRDWAYASFPVYIINYSFFYNDPTLDPDNPLIMFFILQEGASVVDSIYTKPFHRLGPLASDAAGVYDLFASATKITPALNGSLFPFEGYSLQGVKAVPNDHTAFPNRAGNLLVSSLLTYAPNSTALDKTAADLGKSLRQILYEGSGQKELYTYVNYAFGDETENNWYEYEQWCHDRLKALKRKYDPLGKFSFYAPIAYIQ
ncbi:FAD binding domain protein [Xylaria sp. FL1042]|nr:FAD binding domain protein [Xylaria sp. FL1042]